jgi:hypothetical protein
MFRRRLAAVPMLKSAGVTAATGRVSGQRGVRHVNEAKGDRLSEFPPWLRSNCSSARTVLTIPLLVCFYRFLL